MDYQIESIIENRGMIESLVLGTFLNNLTLYGEYKVSINDFIYDKTKFYFGLGRTMSSKYNELDESSVLNFISNNKEMMEDYEKYGGWSSVKKVMEYSNLNNIDAYVDDLAKNNFLISIRERGFNVTDEIELQDRVVKPFEDLFGNLSCREVEGFYDGLLSSCSVKSIAQQVKAENLLITEKDKERLKSKIDSGLPYDIMFSYTEKEIGLSDSDEIKYIYALPALSSITNGIGNGGGSTFITGHSGLGKSTLAFFDVVLPMWYRGEKCLIFSNEVKSQYFKTMLYVFIASNIFKQYTLTRRKIDNGDWNDEEDVLIDKITKFLEDRDFANHVTFINIEEFNIEEIMRISKEYITHYQYGFILIDTYKAEDSSASNYTGQMTENVKKLEVFGNKYNIKVVLTMQLVSGNEMRNAYLTAGDISECKASKTCADLLMMIRKVVNNLELDANNPKMFLKPYKLVKTGSDGWRKRYITFNEKEISEGNYRLLFLNKSRRGDDDIIILLRFDGHLGSFTEIGRCDHCSRGVLTGGK